MCACAVCSRREILPGLSQPALRKQHASLLGLERDRAAEWCPLKQPGQEDETQKGTTGFARCSREEWVTVPCFRPFLRLCLAAAPL